MPRLQNFSGRRLKELRDQKRLTQHDLASKLREHGFGTTQTTISRWEDGQQPQTRVLAVLARELGCKIGEFYVDEDDDESSRIRRIAAELVLRGEDDLASDLLAVVRSQRPQVQMKV